MFTPQVDSPMIYRITYFGHETSHSISPYHIIPAYNKRYTLEKSAEAKSKIHISIKIPESKNKLFCMNFFYQPGPNVKINLSRILGNQLLSGSSENCNESLGTPFFARKVSFPSALKWLRLKICHFETPEKAFPPDGESTSEPETSEIGGHVRNKLSGASGNQQRFISFINPARK